MVCSTSVLWCSLILGLRLHRYLWRCFKLWLNLLQLGGSPWGRARVSPTGAGVFWDRWPHSISFIFVVSSDRCSLFCFSVVFSGNSALIFFAPPSWIHYDLKGLIKEMYTVWACAFKMTHADEHELCLMYLGEGHNVSTCTNLHSRFGQTGLCAWKQPYWKTAT